MVFLGKVPRFKRAAPLELDLSRKCLPVRVLVIGSKSSMHSLVAVVGDLRQATSPVRNCTTRRHAWRAISHAPKALDCTTQAQCMCLLVQCVTLRPEHIWATQAALVKLVQGKLVRAVLDQAGPAHGVDSIEQWPLCLLPTASSTRSLPSPLLSASIYRPRMAGTKLPIRLSMPTNGGQGMCEWTATLAMRHCTVYLRKL